MPNLHCCRPSCPTGPLGACSLGADSLQSKRELSRSVRSLARRPDRAESAAPVGLDTSTAPSLNRWPGHAGRRWQGRSSSGYRWCSTLTMRPPVENTRWASKEATPKVSGSPRARCRRRHTSRRDLGSPMDRKGRTRRLLHQPRDWLRRSRVARSTTGPLRPIRQSYAGPRLAAPSLAPGPGESTFGPGSVAGTQRWPERSKSIGVWDRDFVTRGASHPTDRSVRIGTCVVAQGTPEK